jgi:hypothetical protein
MPLDSDPALERILFIVKDFVYTKVGDAVSILGNVDSTPNFLDFMKQEYFSFYFVVFLISFDFFKSGFIARVLLFFIVKNLF